MDPRTKGATPRARSGKATTDRGQGAPSAGSLDDASRTEAPAQPVAGPAAAPGPTSPVTVDGQPVSEFAFSYASPTCRAHLVTAENGVHEIPAIFYGKMNSEGPPVIGFRPNRIGRFAVQAIMVGPNHITIQ